MASDAVAGDAAQIFLQQIVQSGAVFLQLKKSAAGPAAQMYGTSAALDMKRPPAFAAAEGGAEIFCEHGCSRGYFTLRTLVGFGLYDTLFSFAFSPAGKILGAGSGGWGRIRCYFFRSLVGVDIFLFRGRIRKMRSR
ncbi:MAG: hypothetical protein Q4B25_11275 [Pseudomonadota bacterium]|nr:hypothetical protein [Pseudomonadota bacterium]